MHIRYSLVSDIIVEGTVESLVYFVVTSKCGAIVAVIAVLVRAVDT